MKPIVLTAALSLGLLLGASSGARPAFAQQAPAAPAAPAAPPAPPAAAPAEQSQDTAAPAAPAAAPAAPAAPPQAQPLPPPPPQAPAVSPSTAAGEWVYTDAYGWIWVPTDTMTYEVGTQPYAYIYTPTYGWTWYVSPWGHGRYFVGPWVHRAWGAPHVWYGNRWVARPHFVGHAAYGHAYGPARVVAHPAVGRGGGGHHR